MNHDNEDHKTGIYQKMKEKRKHISEKPIRYDIWYEHTHRLRVSFVITMGHKWAQPQFRMVPIFQLCCKVGYIMFSYRYLASGYGKKQLEICGICLSLFLSLIWALGSANSRESADALERKVRKGLQRRGKLGEKGIYFFIFLFRNWFWYFWGNFN